MGWDSLTNNILKKIPHILAPHITHFFNSIINKSHYPFLFKISKILPQIKPGKDPINPDSFRPINNLPTLEKLFESYIIELFIEFLTANHIFDKNHHGGMKFHSPKTAMAAIQISLSSNLDKNAILSTDLSAAYDTVDHLILLKKLENKFPQNIILRNFQEM